MERVLDMLLSGGYSAVLRSFSAIDRYLGQDDLPFVSVETSAGLSDLARLFEDLRFPGAALADGAVFRDGRTYLFRCVDPDEPAENAGGPAFALLAFGQDAGTEHFLDPSGVYRLLRKIGSGHADEIFRAAGAPNRKGYCRSCMEAALVLARYCHEDETRPGVFEEIISSVQNPVSTESPPGTAEQRFLLSGLLVSPSPALGLELLKKTGFLAEFWPELAILDNVDHSKEFHPEGNVWKHTLETFRYRKPSAGRGYDLRLSLGLLLHDAGKPLSEPSGNRRFDGHAELGAREARRFLERLGFEEELIEEVRYLVKNHMLPAALPRLPLAKTGGIMSSPLFPSLMELYRCDESSSFKGLDGYYESSAAYQSYLRYRRNPYRSADGKKIRSLTR
ncbi:MAG: HD domain-containing protein [Treponema sp.]|jgi:poly(A) polymerase|nr:HD domain-containing protein [Treponema sp.]